MKLIEDIEKLKKEKKAVILAHNYQIPEVQDVADFVGDSLALSIQASKTDAEMIVFCGVHFMAETAKILHRMKKENPEKLFYPAYEDTVCPNMKKITLEKVLWSLEDMKAEILVPEDIRIRALQCLDRMLAFNP